MAQSTVFPVTSGHHKACAANENAKVLPRSHSKNEKQNRVWRSDRGRAFWIVDYIIFNWVMCLSNNATTHCGSFFHAISSPCPNCPCLSSPQVKIELSTDTKLVDTKNTRKYKYRRLTFTTRESDEMGLARCELNDLDPKRQIHRLQIRRRRELIHYRSVSRMNV